MMKSSTLFSFILKRNNSLIRIFILPLFLLLINTTLHSHELKASNQISAGIAEDSWSTKFILKDYLDLYVFPEELISYEFTCPPGAVKKEKLKLWEEGKEEPLTYQLTDIDEKNGYLVKAVIHFRTGLDRMETKTFVLEQEAKYTPAFEDEVIITDIDKIEKSAIIRADKQQVKVPYGDWRPNKSIEVVNAPIMAISRENGDWMARGQFTGDATVVEIATSILEDGPLFIKYQVQYQLSDERSYTVTLQVEKGEHHVVVDEYMENFGTSAPEINFRLSYKEGMDPDGRLALANNGNYSDRSGYYEEDVQENGQLPYNLGIFGYNSKVPRSTVFYRDNGNNGLVFSLCKLHQWKTASKYVWAMFEAPENMFFYAKNDDKYMQMKVCGVERHWAVSVIPRENVVIASQHENPPYYEYEEWYARPDMEGWDDKMKAGGPDARLFQKLGAYSLDWVKNLVFEWDSEDLDANFWQYNTEDYGIEYDEFWKGQDGEWPDELFWGSVDWRSRWQSPERYADAMLYGAKSMGRTKWQLYACYGASRKLWTEEQRIKTRAWIIHMLAMNMFLDDNLPHESMMGGHPNFYIESIYPGVFAAIFPNHPYSQKFKTEYQEILHEFLHVYLRKGDNKVNTQPGRYTENITCYSYASMAGVLKNAVGFHQMDGSYILDDPYFQNWMQWHLDALMTAGPKRENGLIATPPIGAHARETTWEDLKLTAEFMSENDDILGDHLLWAVTGGDEGMQPILQSKTYEDYGAIMRYDVGSPNEAYLTMQLIGSADPVPGYSFWGTMNYRWGGGGGILYYSANDKHWSWNAAEDNGDDYSAERTTSFTVDEVNSSEKQSENNLNYPSAIRKYGENLGRRKIETLLYDFDFVQYFKSTEDNEAKYRSRSMMMLGDRYIAIYDDVSDESVPGTFHWVNQENGLMGYYYDNSDFTNLKMTRKDSDRFPVDFEWGDGAPASSMDKDNFSIRWETRVKSQPGISGEHNILIDLIEGSEDRLRIWFEGEEKLDVTGKDGSFTINLEDGRFYSLKMEYQHFTGEAQCRMGIKELSGEDKDAAGIRRGYNARRFYIQYDMPHIHTVRGAGLAVQGMGDQLHLVEPRTEPVYKVKEEKYGARIDKEHVLMVDENQSVNMRRLIFDGRAGYATENKVAVFDGTRIGYDDLIIELSNSNFGASAEYIDGNHIKGTLTGFSGGSIKVNVPSGFNLDNKVVIFKNRILEHRREGNAISFEFDIIPTDGAVEYEIRPAN